MKKERIKASKFETVAFIGSESYVWFLNYWLQKERDRQQKRASSASDTPRKQVVRRTHTADSALDQ